MKRIKMPHVFALLTMVILGCALLTWIVPSGAFERESKVIEGTTRTLVVPGSYEQIPKHYSLEAATVGEKVEGRAAPVGLHGFLSAIPRGMEQAADIIFFIFMIGGAFGILQRTGVIAASINKLLEKLGGNGPLLTAAIMFVIALGGSTLGMGEEFIPLVPVFLIVSMRLGYDRIYGMAMVILAAQMGFAAATTNPFTVGVAQGIAELPLISGWQLRVAFFVCCYAVTLTYMLRYGARLKADPSASYLDDGDEFHIEDPPETEAFGARHVWIVIACVAIFAGVLYAVTTMGWWMADMGGGFFLMGVIAAAIAGLSLNEAARAFVKGMEEMVVAALVVGFAKGIQVVLTDGQILDTVIFHATNFLGELPKVIAVQGMFLVQTGLNFLIPSGSGQAAVTMPLMAPIADILGVTRQTAVFAFQCGDGFSNLIIPTSAILMSMLALAKIPYERWLRFMAPLLLQLLLLSAVFLTIAVYIGYK